MIKNPQGKSYLKGRQWTPAKKNENQEGEPEERLNQRSLKNSDVWLPDQTCNAIKVGSVKGASGF